MAQAVDALSAQYGTLFVIAAGNAGPETISAPGAAAAALTVGAVDKQDSLACFSSTGPLAGSGALKPDLAAPGVDITAARSQEMTDGGDGPVPHPQRHLDGHARTSPARRRSWPSSTRTGPVQQLKEQLMSSAKGLADGYSPFEVGTGRVDVAAAVRRHGARRPGRSSSATTRGRTSPSDAAGHQRPHLHQRRRHRTSPSTSP